ncbi:MAG: serine/threonine-protein phosphatase [Clostridia bacterium]|nr:serine/threonine-protein phosphatase [Clostridia bacterium]
MFLGASKAAKFESHEFDLQAGDCLFVYTDGVPEAINEAEKMFGEERMIRTLNEDPDAGPEELIRRVHGAVDRFADRAPQFDDITMLCLKYRGTTEEGQA